MFTDSVTSHRLVFGFCCSLPSSPVWGLGMLPGTGHVLLNAAHPPAQGGVSPLPRCRAHRPLSLSFSLSSLESIHSDLGLGRSGRAAWGLSTNKRFQNPVAVLPVSPSSLRSTHTNDSCWARHCRVVLPQNVPAGA